MDGDVVELPATIHESPRRDAHRAALLHAAAFVVLGLFLMATPLPVMLGRFIPDDTFYYYRTAWHFSQTGHSTFDGIHFTNGYQPLWFLLITPFFWLFPEGGEPPIRVLMVVQIALSAGAIMVMIRTVSRYFGVMSTSIAFVVWLLTMQRTMVNGLETSLQMFLYALLFDAYTRLHDHPGQRVGAGRLLWLGLLAALLFLARTDAGFLVGALSIAVLYRLWRGSEQHWRNMLSFVLPIAVLAGGYLAINFLQTGHLMPVSGAAKAFHSELARKDALAHAPSRTQVWLDNILWLFQTSNFRYIAFGLAVPWVLVLLSWIKPLRPHFGEFRAWWPFFFGATLSWLFYAIMFYGGFTRTLWYYGPQSFLTCLAIAGIGAAIERSTFLRFIPGAIALLLVAYAADWASSEAILIGCGVLVVLAFLISRIPQWSWPPVWVVLWIAVAVIWVALLMERGATHWTWSRASAITLVLVAIGLRIRPSPRAAVSGTGVVLAGAAWTSLMGMMGDVAGAPAYWNYNLYRGALWARENLPEGATIWSGSSGILGYFSDRTVVNADGLANDFDFLERFKHGQFNDYVRQWDYCIDAMADEGLVDVFPEGKFIEMPKELQTIGFEDGALNRRLRVFQMNRDRTASPLPEPEFRLTAPSKGTFTVGSKLRIKWSAANVRRGSTISLGYDADTIWDNGNEKWIFVDELSAANGKHTYEWDTSGVAPGSYYLDGYLYDGKKNWKVDRLSSSITLVP